MSKESGDREAGRGLAWQAARRRWLRQAGALVSTVALPWRLPDAAAQSPSNLNALPRVALVIGNSKYIEAPLRNPGNDARDIAAELQKLRFQVNLRLDAGRNEMIEAIHLFGADLGAKKCIGVFYYAGHGAQLAWKNYLIPVDAAIARIEDMQTRAVELNSLLEGLIKAQNPMNVIILDACRDNPFGNKVQSQQKGLSQFDAPPGSLLAYATSPGNTAADGEGANGLYTENLLNELRVPEAKIEDVFKRVRLNVRRRSGGQQIPWESTSLEDDFYFLPPQRSGKPSEAETERQFSEELAVWEKIKNAKEPGPLEEYLRKNPSGRFSELVQFQLDRVLARQGEKKVELVFAPENPFTKGVTRVDTLFKIGDSYSYRDIDMYTKQETRSVTQRVTAISDNEVIFNKGVLVTDLFGNQIKAPNGNVFTGAQFFIPEYALGKKWSTRYKITYREGQTGEFEVELKVVARETITVPAGTFDAFRVEGEGWGKGFGNVNVKYKYWIAPGIRRPVASEDYRRLATGKVNANERRELTAYSQQ